MVFGWSNLAQALNPEEGLAEYRHVILRTGDRGLIGHTYSVTQSEDGYLWVGTTSGLFRFDGVHFSQEGGSPLASRGGATPSVYRSSDGSLWFSGLSGVNRGLVRLKDQRA